MDKIKNNNPNLTLLPKLKTDTNFYTQKSVLKRNNLPINLCETLTPKKIKKFKKIFFSLSKIKSKNNNNKNNMISTYNTTNTQNSISTNAINNTNINNIIKEELSKIRRNSVINTETELKMNKFLERFNLDKKQKKNAEYDLIKGKMFNRLKNYLVLNAQSYHTTYDNNDDYSSLQKQKEFVLKKRYDFLTKKKINIITNSQPQLFNSERITRRFEDLYMTPEEFLNKNFKKDEIDIMIKNANYFKLNKGSLKDWDLKINFTLKDSLDKEEYLLNQMKLENELKKKLRFKLDIKQETNKEVNKENNDKTKNNISINNITPQKTLDLDNDEKKKKIPKLNLVNLNGNGNDNENDDDNDIHHENSIPRGEIIKKVKKFKFCINPKNKLLYMVPISCTRQDKHRKMYNSTERGKTSRDFYRKTMNKLRNNNSKHIEKFELKKHRQNEFLETQNVLNEIKSNYMRKNHEKVTKDNIIKNKIKFNDNMQKNIKEKIKKLNKKFQLVKIGYSRIYLSEKLWK